MIEDCRDDLAIAGAAAQHPADGVHHRALVRLFVAGEQTGRGHQHARRADAALGRTVALEGRLEGRKRAVGGQALDRCHFSTGHLPDRDQAGAHLLAIEQNRAGPAIAGVAADLGAGQPKLVA